MPKGSKDQIQAVAKNKGVSTEKAAAMVGGKAPANKGKLKKFSGSAGAVGKAQKVLKNKESTPEQRAKAKASIAKAADKMRGNSLGGLFKQADAIGAKYGKGGDKSLDGLSVKQLFDKADALKGKAKAVPTGSMASSNRLTGKSRLEALRDTNLTSYRASEAGTTGKTRGKIISNLTKSEAARAKATPDQIESQREKMAAKANYKRSQKGKGGTLKPSRATSTYVPTKKDKLDFVRDNAQITRKAKAKGVTKSVNKTSKLKLDKTMKMFDFKF
jgi:hypothetical protein